MAKLLAFVPLLTGSGCSSTPLSQNAQRHQLLFVPPRRSGPEIVGA
jgi:hypothetical protein